MAVSGEGDKLNNWFCGWAVNRKVKVGETKYLKSTTGHHMDPSKFQDLFKENRKIKINKNWFCGWTLHRRAKVIDQLFGEHRVPPNRTIKISSSVQRKEKISQIFWKFLEVQAQISPDILEYLTCRSFAVSASDCQIFWSAQGGKLKNRYPLN